MKNAANSLLRRIFGYQLVKFDPTPYQFREKLVAFIEDERPAGKILDIGSARWSHPKERFRNVTTLDLEPPADVIGSVMQLPCKDGTFDTVFCFETLEHVDDPPRAIREIQRVLKPGGKLIASAPFMYELHGEEYGDYWRFTRQGWEKLLTGFSEKKVIPFSGRKNAPGWYFVSAKK